MLKRKSLQTDKAYDSILVSKQDVVVGKDILELVTGAMYVNPLSIYREYVQNSTDAIDELTSSKARDNAGVSIIIDVAQRTVRIRDSGAGISNSHFIEKMTAVGGSEKRGKAARGFRGVGRLSGLGYCKRLTFRGKAGGEKRVFEISWDGRKFKEILRDSDYDRQLPDVIKAVTSARSYEADDPDPFFEVELAGLIRIKNDVLVNADAIYQYLAQVAPVPFAPDFQHGDTINEKLEEFGLGSRYQITIEESGAIANDVQQVFRPYRNSFDLSPFKKDSLKSIRFFEVYGIEGQTDALVWIGDHSYLGAIPNDQLIKGLRFRCGNIQVGGHDLAADWFPESRFNSWVVGEVHILNRRIVPNGRRDNFEENAHFANLESNLLPELKGISKVCRERSSKRQWLRRFEGIEAEVQEDLKLLMANSLSQRQTSRLAKTADEKVIELEHRIERDSYGLGGQLKPRVKKLRKNLDSVRDREVDDNDPLSVVPYNKRLAFQEVFELIYTSVNNKPVANSIIDRIVKRLAAKYGAQ